MGINSIGENISKLRKERNVTQETLANHVGVSTQAVSKWENGGVPDIELLPSIADYFEVSIDALFGRNLINENDIHHAISNRFNSIPHDERFKFIFDMLWSHQLMAGELDYVPINEINPAYSYIDWENGLSLFKIQQPARYAFFLSKLSEAEGLSDWLFDDIDYTSFFKTLSEKDSFDSLLLLYKTPDIRFTADHLVKNINITVERACEIIDNLNNLEFLELDEIEINGDKTKICKLHHKPKFVIMLIFARELLKSPESYYLYIGNQDKRFL